MKSDELNPYGSFHQASRGVLEYLHKELGFDLWMVTRTEGEDWIVLEAVDHGYGVSRGDVFQWTDSFCSRMIKGLGPRIAPCSDLIAAYVEAPIGTQVKIGAYIGVPLRWNDGRLFGTMCAIHPTPRPDWIEGKLDQVELYGRLLSSILHSEIKAIDNARIAERAELEAVTDALTGLYNRRGWDRLLAVEESRCRKYGHPSCMISIDIDNLKVVNDSLGHASGDELIQRTGQVIRNCIRSQDVAARLGGDEFAVLAIESDTRKLEDLMTRLQHALADNHILASLGMSICKPHLPFATSYDLADREMYAMKRDRAALLC